MGRATVFFALLVGAALSACCGNGSGGAPGTIDGEITVFAASSLSEAFKEVGAAFEKANPGTRVTFNFAASSALAVQINEGAPADVFASADTAQMKNVNDQGNAEGSAVFATNTPVVVVPKDGKAVATFADIAKPGIKLVLAGKDVPIGRYARRVLAKASGTGGVSPGLLGQGAGEP
ncbi:molybdate ABC transporter substrate-binding protein [Candidatus Amarobacter glycogenicus]|uniref:molybdate ABC transporter substrate-binding protein n=1 Tax=Candidatus Amarobacter glycogenicus TaxID=3140699 RepID=UPI002A1540C8|nr:molybdate ABC transporter substrate-binding protein [Dehalococcoidia bacterium]